MFIVFLRFTACKAEAGQFMQGHKDWIQRGFEAGVFLMTGSLQPQAGGMVVADRIAADELRRLVEADPFVAEGIVSPEIVEVSPGRVDERLGFLLE